MKFNENLVKYRKLKGLTQEEMAEKMQVSRQSVSKWENGEAVPELAKIMKLADILDVSLDVLCGRDEQSIPENKCESKNTKKKQGKVFLSMILAVAIVASGILGFYIGSFEKETASSKVYELPDTIEVADVIFNVQDKKLTCEFVPSIYSENLSYRVIVSDEFANKTYTPNFENGIGTAIIPVGKYNMCNLFLEISNGEETRSVGLGKIYIHENTITYHE